MAPARSLRGVCSLPLECAGGRGATLGLLPLEGSYVTPGALRPTNPALISGDLRAAAVCGVGDGVYGRASLQEGYGLCGTTVLG
jgi:hypothetical protein